MANPLPTGYADSNLLTILPLIVQNLLTNVPLLEGDIANCFASLNPKLCPSGRPGNYIVMVGPLGGQFDLGLVDGGGTLQVSNYSQIVIGIHSQGNLDLVDEETATFEDVVYGLLQAYNQVLNAMELFMPVNGSGQRLVRQPMRALNYTFGNNGNDNYVAIVFECFFDEQLVPAINNF